MKSCASSWLFTRISSTKFIRILCTTYKEHTFQLTELLNADGQMEITKLIDELLEIFYVQTQKLNKNCNKIFEFDIAKIKFVVTITASKYNGDTRELRKCTKHDGILYHTMANETVLKFEIYENDESEATKANDS